jgi:hypothetical protein
MLLSAEEDVEDQVALGGALESLLLDVFEERLRALRLMALLLWSCCCWDFSIGGRRAKA